jgi:hypothetical protein
VPGFGVLDCRKERQSEAIRALDLLHSTLCSPRRSEIIAYIDNDFGALMQCQSIGVRYGAFIFILLTHVKDFYFYCFLQMGIFLILNILKKFKDQKFYCVRPSMLPLQSAYDLYGSSGESRAFWRGEGNPEVQDLSITAASR